MAPDLNSTVSNHFSAWTESIATVVVHILEAVMQPTFAGQRNTFAGRTYFWRPEVDTGRASFLADQPASQREDTKVTIESPSTASDAPFGVWSRVAMI
jgi:hypothetical protein